MRLRRGERVRKEIDFNMLPPIYIDISEVAEEFLMSDEEIQSLSRFILANVADKYVREWEKLVDDNLHSTRDEYKKGIFQEQPDDTSIVIGLTPRQSPMALMLEDGASSFDEKEGFAKSDKKRTKQDGGWYLTIPFRFATAEALGESAIFSNKMPKPIEKLVKTMKSPLKFEDLPPGFNKIGQNKTSEYKHKFNIYEGLQRIESGSGQEKRGVYMTFRRVSDKSDPDSWIHPGFQALRLMEQASDKVDIGQLVDFSVDQFLSER